MAEMLYTMYAYQSFQTDNTPALFLSSKYGQTSTC